MPDTLVLRTIASVLAAAAPLVYAALGETITERAGIVNLSLDGSILLSAMAGFAIAFLSGSLLLGVLAAMGVGAAVALLIAYGSIALRQDQVALGFVLTLLGGHLSSFLGLPFSRVPGPSMPHLPIPGLSRIPVLGPILFDHDLLIYGSYLLVILSWVWIYHTPQGLRLRAIGEQPAAAYARGVNVNRLRYLYTAAGGALVGLAGASYSLSIKLGWSHRHTAGMGWIALAIVIFAGWSPFRVALGAFLFGALKSAGSILQPVYPNVPTQVFQAAPFALMIVALLLANLNAEERLPSIIPVHVRRAFVRLIRGTPPAALGRRFDQG